jgi:hypothetical protein
MQRKISAALKANKQQLIANVGYTIVSELQIGDVKEAFLHLKGWYWTALETQVRPCHQTM